MKKLAFSMAAMAFMLSASAAESDEEQNNTATEAAYDGEDLKPSGVYGGFGLTLTNNEWQQSTTGVDLTQLTQDDDGNNVWLSLVGQEGLLGHDHTNNTSRISPVLFLGYGFLYKNFWIAPEVSVQLAPNVEVYNSRTDIVTCTRRDSESWIRGNGIQPTLALKIGYYCARWNSVVYAKFGAVYKKFTWSDSEFICDGWALGEQVNYTPATDDDPEVHNGRAVFCGNSKKFSNWRFVFGVGASRALSKYITVSGELTYTLGKKMKMTVDGSALSVNGARVMSLREDGTSIPINGPCSMLSDRTNQALEFHDKGTIGVGIYAQWNIWKPQSSRAL